jgi:hypothetical protein
MPGLVPGGNSEVSLSEHDEHHREGLGHVRDPPGHCPLISYLPHGSSGGIGDGRIINDPFDQRRGQSYGNQIQPQDLERRHRRQALTGGRRVDHHSFRLTAVTMQRTDRYT